MENNTEVDQDSDCWVDLFQLIKKNSSLFIQFLRKKVF